MLSSADSSHPEKIKKEVSSGVPTVAQQVTNPTNIHQEVGSIPGLTQRVKDLALPELWCRSQTQTGSGVAVAVA